MLVQDLNKFVAISEEFPNNPTDKVKAGGLLFDRKIVRVITPGTLIDEKFMDPWENNFLLSIYTESGPLEVGNDESSKVGLAWADISSGFFYTKVVDHAALSSEIARISPREIIVDRALEVDNESQLSSVLGDEKYRVTFHQVTSSKSEWLNLLEREGGHSDRINFSDAEVKAGSHLLSYIKLQFQGREIQLQAPVKTQASEYMMIDKNSLRALEVKQTLRYGNYEGSLLHTIRRTSTKSGARLLSQRLTSPSTSLEEINDRLDLLKEVLDYPLLHQDLVSLLRQTFDSWRLVQKFSFGRGDADDLLSLSRTISLTSLLAEKLTSHLDSFVAALNDSGSPHPSYGTQAPLKRLLSRLSLEDPANLSKRILDTIDEEMLSEQHRLEDNEAATMVQLAEEVLSEAGEGDTLKGVPRALRSKLGKANGNSHDTSTGEDIWIMRRGASKSLSRLHDELDKLMEEKVALATQLRDRSGAQSLTLKWTPGLGHIAHMKGKDTLASTSALGSVRSVGSSRTTRSLHIPEWTHLGTRIDEARLRIRNEESKVFNSLREDVIHNLVTIRRNAAVLDELDVTCSFATLAKEYRLIRPLLNSGSTHRIIGGRHPMVETGLKVSGRTFTSNDCTVGNDSSSYRIILVTGPNMAGKSTFLRQNALISILAQTGSYVPAEYAEIGIVDKLFSRVGSADNIYQDQSTFMIEMLETSTILKQATPRSFVIMDEVGRGTTPEDGIAVGFACLWHLYHVNKCRTLFATHFHALADMTSNWEGLGTYCTDVLEHASDGSWSFVHKLRPGVCTRSHALKVARLAGESLILKFK